MSQSLELWQEIQKYAFSLFMKQAHDGKHLYTLEDIAKKVNKKSAKNLPKKVTSNAINKWCLRKYDDGTTWRGCYNKALAKGNGRIKPAKTPAKTSPKSAKVTPIDSARKNVNSCIHKVLLRKKLTENLPKISPKRSVTVRSNFAIILYYFVISLYFLGPIS